MKVLFLYLKAFSFTGGIEKFNRSFLKALHELSVDGFMDADAISAYDSFPDEKYFPRLRFRGFDSWRLLFVFDAFFKSFKYQTVIIGHINLAVVGYWIKRVNPSVRLVIIAHGIEVWKTQYGNKRRALEKADIILAVSNFTKQKIVEFNLTVNADKIKIFPNAIDPHFKVPVNFAKPAYLLHRYGLSATTPVLLTVTRLAFSEKYKGYDGVIESMPDLLNIDKNLVYLICGKADNVEKERIELLIEKTRGAHSVKLLGFIPDSELIDHYLLADVFIMQSKKEGFGIVFIEALACGRMVIAGSKDGSSEALLQGELGKLIDPDNKEELRRAIDESLNAEGYDPSRLQKRVIGAFGFDKYKDRLKDYLINENQDAA